MTIRTFLSKLWRDQTWRWRGPRVAIMFLVLALGSLMFMEDSFIYYPSTFPEGNWDYPGYRIAPGETGVMIEDVTFFSYDGVELHGWYCQPAYEVAGEKRALPSRGTILWCHGNAGNITHRYTGIQELTKLGVAVFIFDYRGYGRSGGTPSEKGLYRDTTAAWQHLTQRRGLDPARIIIKGVSLGGAPATELALREPAAGLILESTFTSAPDMAAIILPIMPRFMVRSKFNTIDRLPQVASPVLLLHGTADTVIPYRMGETLAAVAPTGTRFVPIDGADHDDVAMVGGQTYIDAYQDFFRHCGWPRDAEAPPPPTTAQPPIPMDIPEDFLP